MVYIYFDFGMAIFEDINEAASFMEQQQGGHCVLRRYPDTEPWQGIQWLYKCYWDRLIGGDLGDVEVSLPTVEELREHKVFAQFRNTGRRTCRERYWVAIGWDRNLVGILSATSSIPDFINSTGAQYVEVVEATTIGAAYRTLNCRLYGGFAFAMPYGVAPYCLLGDMRLDTIYSAPALGCFRQLVEHVPGEMRNYCNRLLGATPWTLKEPDMI